MKLLRTATIALATLSAGFTTAASAEYLYGFGNVSISRLDWSADTERNTRHKDFTFLELEGGAGFTWGEVYGFIDLENPHKSEDEGRSVAMKGNARVKLGDTGFNLFGQVYNLSVKGLHEQNRFVGFGYNFTGDNYFFKPVLALHNANKTGFSNFSGNNGYMFGWVAGYNFNLADQSFTVSNWHEYEFNRNEKYHVGKDGKAAKSGYNGAVALWWNATDSITTGVQYRYADNKLGNNRYQSGMIYTLKYNF